MLLKPRSEAHRTTMVFGFQTEQPQNLVGGEKLYSEIVKWINHWKKEVVVVPLSELAFRVKVIHSTSRSLISNLVLHVYLLPVILNLNSNRAPPLGYLQPSSSLVWRCIFLYSEINAWMRNQCHCFYSNIRQSLTIKVKFAPRLPNLTSKTK